MGKKGTKRKTQWRTLAITECPQQHSKSALIKKYSLENNSNSVNLTNTTETNNVDKAISQDDDYSNHKSYTDPSYFKRKLSTSSDYRNDYRHNYSYSYSSKHNSTSSTSSLYSSSRYPSYRRRPFSSLQNGSSRYSSFGAERTTSRGHRTSISNRTGGNTTIKHPFNEDDYTRISTPRQDVIFKKGYFSQPKKYMSSTDTNTTSSAAASIVSGEESVSALSVPSLSPEQCSSLGDPLDPEQGFVYSFIDQNGVVYSCVPNGFDQYNSQMMMLPYGFPPYMCSPEDVISPTGLNEEESEQNRTSVESHEIPSSDLNETKVIDEVPKDASSSIEETLSAQENDDNKNGEEVKEATSDEAETSEVTVTPSGDAEITEEIMENEEIPDAVQNIPEQFYNYGYPPYYSPQILYPYMIPQQFVPVFGNEFDVPNEEEYTEDLADQDGVQYKCRKKRRDTAGNSTGVSAATTDYSDDEDVQDENSNPKEESMETEEGEDNDMKESVTQSNETEHKQVTLNVNVKEFVPRGIVKSTLNVNVEEFHPRSRKNSTSTHDASEHQGQLPALSETKQVRPIPDENGEQAKPVQNRVEKRSTELTLAEKIKQRLAEESKEQKRENLQKSLPQRRSAKKYLSRKLEGTQKRSSRVAKKPENPSNEKTQPPQTQNSPPSQPSYAQIANSRLSTNDKIITDAVPTSKENVVNQSPTENLVDPTKKAESVNKPTAVYPETSAEANTNAVVLPVDTWQTVKPRGKRGKHIKERTLDENYNEEVLEESIEQVETIGSLDSSKEESSDAKDEPEELEEPEKPKECEEHMPVPNSTSETVSAAEAKSEETVPSTPKKKTPKAKGRKGSKKTKEGSAKKQKKLELVEPVFELPNKTETSNENEELSHDVIDSKDDAILEEVETYEINADDIESSQSRLSPPKSDFSFDRLFLTKGFVKNPLDILKGFDYKYKNNSILREEEEMVLNVIKSISNNASSPPRVSPSTSMIEEDDDEDKTIVDNQDGQDNCSETDTVSELSSGGDGEENNFDIQVKSGSSGIFGDMTETKAEDLNQISKNDSDRSCEVLADDLSKGSRDSSCCAEVNRNHLPTIETTADTPIEAGPQVNEGEDSKESEGAVDDFPSTENTEATDNAPEQKDSIELPDVQVPANLEAQDVHQITEEIRVAVNDELKDTSISNQVGDDQQVGNDKTEEVTPEVTEVSPKERLDVSDIDILENEIVSDNNILHETQKESRAIQGENHLTNGQCDDQISEKLDIDVASDDGGKTTEVDISVKNTDPAKLQKSPYVNHNGLVDDKENISNNLLENKSLDDISEFITSPPKKVELTNRLPNLSFDNPDTNEVLKSTAEQIRIITNGDLDTSSHSSLENLNESFTPLSELSNEDVTNEVRRSLTGSPFEHKERILEDLDEIIVPKLDTKDHNGSTDFTACLNVLNTIIQSRECSLEPEKSSANLIHRKYSLQPKVSRECSIEPAIDRKCSLEPGCKPTEDYLTCVNVLSNLIRSRECSIEPETAGKEIGLNGWSDFTDKETEAAVNGLDIKNFPIVDRKEKTQHASSEREGIDRGTVNSNGSDSSESIADSGTSDDMVNKDSSRILNASISCDRSSGIGSDYEDNQPSSPGCNETKHHSSTVVDSNLVSPNGRITRKLFPCNTAAPDDVCSRQTENMPTFVLPNLSQSNSVNCDNQFVSYTSSKSYLGSTANTDLTSLRESKCEDLALSTSSKFPSSSENQSNQFPLTEAVKLWLVQESKEPTPEPLLRIPDDPCLKSFLAKRLQPADADEEDDYSSTDGSESESDPDNLDRYEPEEKETDYLQKHKSNPKNLVSNPLHVSSCNEVTIDSDSDYNSDSNDHHLTDRSDDNTCKRVAEIFSDNSESQSDKNDLLEYWDDEFIRNPKKWLGPRQSTASSLPTAEIQSRSTSAIRDSRRSPSAEVEPYESVYGKTIDYNQLLASNCEFLSSNILSFNKNDRNEKPDNKHQTTNMQIKTSEIYRESKQSLGSNNNFYNKTPNNNTVNNLSASSAGSPASPSKSSSRLNPNDENCLKPPEVCCVLM